jgi:signal peptidase I
MENPVSLTPVQEPAPINNHEDRHNKHVKRGLRDILSTVLLILAAPVLALLIINFVFQPYEVYGVSMETTLNDRDRLIVVKAPKTIATIMRREYIPKRGEIIVFNKPGSLPSLQEVDHLIKRVIGLPGERVVVRDGTITVFNQENPNGFNPDEGQEYAKDILTTPGDVDIVVGQNEIFVCGDNRTNSTDSRRFGAISSDLLIGVAKYRFVPVNDMRSL